MISGQAMQAIAGRPSAASALRTTRSGARINQPRLRLVAPRAGFLDFLTPTAAPKTGKKAGRAVEIVDELLELTRNTDGGLKASPSRKAEIEELVEELSGYCMRSPLRSDLIFGEWEVVYASKPQTAGGPFRSPLGRTVFPGQRAVQVIAEPNVCINEVSYKTLGFIPGAARQEGEIEPVNETTFQITFPALDNKKRGAGGPPQRLIEVLYLDDRIRIGRAIPQNEDDEGSFYVFERVEEEEEEEEEEPVRAPVRQQRGRAAPAPVQAEEPEQPARKSFDFGTQIFGKKNEGMATMAERAVAQKGGRPAPAASGTQRRGAPTPPAARAAPAAPVRKTREELAAERAAAKERAEEERRARAEAAAAARAAAEEERRAKAEAAAAARAAAEEERRRAKEQAEEERRKTLAAAEAERAAAAQRQAAAREQFEEFASAATEAASEAKDAAAAYKAAEREATALIRAASQARGLIAKAVAAAEEAGEELAEAQAEEVAAEKEVLQQQRLVNELEKKLRQVSAAIAPRIKK